MESELPTTLIASTRNLSAGGLAFLHSSALPPDTLCRVRLLDRQGKAHMLPARVVHCRPVQCRLFEVGLKFDSLIEPEAFLSDTESK
jgi:hypothetical protein